MIYNALGSEIYECNDISGSGLETAYDISGNIVYTRHSGQISDIDYSVFTKTTLGNINAASSQGFAIFNGVVFEMIASNKMNTYTYPDAVPMYSSIPITCGHGDSASFIGDYYTDTDAYPLLYVTADTNPALVYVNRVTENSSELIKTLRFPLEKTGYYAALAYDTDRDIAYMLGYKTSNYQSDLDGLNTTVVSKWDFKTLTDNGDGTMTPLFISSYERDFIYVMQGLTYHDGLIWVTSGYSNSSKQYVYALNPDTGATAYTIDIGNTLEVEGCEWVHDDNAAHNPCLIISQRGSSMVRFEFPEQITEAH